ncbi:MAG: cytochrome-c oxidase, cbb3-type subunit III [Rubrivivax sp.]|nr:cytochrome-c oxidase, cbb3-type subunit III [Rubrivivax sp.]
MSDFVSGGWSLFVAAITVISLIACLVLLVIASRRQVMADDNTTGHVWDEDLKELNNPLPRWWMWLFVITVVFAAVYLAFYPGLGSNAGTLKWSSAGQLQTETDKHLASMAPVYAKYKTMSAADLAKDSGAMGIGERLYLNNCAACHGSDGRGSKGFPNLADADWLGGTGAEYVAKVIKEGRTGVMPPMGAAVGSAEDVKNLSQYVLSLSGSAHDSVAASLGKAKFGACAACHGADGKGNQALGAPNLTDKVWLHGFGEAAITKIINEGRTNVMPPQGRLLTADQVHVLSAYVLNLSQSTSAVAQK